MRYCLQNNVKHIYCVKVDIKYSLLKCHLEHIPENSNEYKFIDQYLKATGPNWRKVEIIDVFSMDRHGEKERFTKNKNIKHRKLLWHGTKVAAMIAILTNGLR